MPISQSAKKSLRASRRKTDLNRARKNLIKETLKKASVKNLAQIISIIDKAVKWRIFHPNKAARLKSRFMAQFTDSSKKKSSKKDRPAPKETAGKKPPLKASPSGKAKKRG